MRTNKTRAGIMTAAGAGVAALALTGFALPANAADGDISADTTSVSEQTSTWNDLGLDDFMTSIGDAIAASGNSDNSLIEGPLVSDSLNGAVGSGNDTPIGSGNDITAPIGSGNDTSVDAPIGNGNEVGNGNASGNETGNGNNVGSGNDTSVGDIGAEVGDVVTDVTGDVDDVVSDVTSDLDSTLNGIFE